MKSVNPQEQERVKVESSYGQNKDYFIAEYNVNYALTKDTQRQGNLTYIKYGISKKIKNYELMELKFFDAPGVSMVGEFGRKENKIVDGPRWNVMSKEMIKVPLDGMEECLLEDIISQLQPEAQDLLTAFRNSGL